MNSLLASLLYAQSTQDDPSTQDLELLKMVCAAVVALIVGAALFYLRDFTSQKHKATESRNQYESLLYLFLKEVAAGIESCNQYVRQIAMSQASASKLSILTTPGHMSRIGELTKDPALVPALHDIYRLFDLVQFQIEKFTSSGNPDDFKRVIAFVRDDIPMFRKASDSLIAACDTNLKGDMKVASQAVKQKLTDFRTECAGWLNAHHCLSVALSFTPEHGDIDLKVIEDLLDGVPERCNFLRGLHKFLLNSARSGPQDEDPLILDEPNWMALAKLGESLIDKPILLPSNPTNSDMLKLLFRWYRYIKRHNPKTYDPYTPSPK